MSIVDRAADTLFDEFARSDTAPKSHTESMFRFLNRRAGSSWDRVRREAEKWYAAFPDVDRKLRNRFREDDVHQHLPAWWELYTYTLFRRLGYCVEVDPQLSGSTKKKRKKLDFLVSRGSESMYVESATVFNGDDIENPDGQAWVCDCVNRAQNPDFWVDLKIEKVGTKRPSGREIIRRLEAWLAPLDWAAARADPRRDSPRWRWQHPLPHGWVLDYTAIPMPPDSRGMPGRRIAIYPTPGAAFIHDIDKIRDKLEDKGSKYSSLQRPLDKPLIVALQFWRSVDQFELKKALFGDVRVTWSQNDITGLLRSVRIPDGYWRPGTDPRGTRISAVLFGNTLRESNVASNLPELGSTHGQRTRCPNCSHSQHSPSTATATSSRVTRHVQPQTSSGYPVSGPTSIDVGAATPAMPGWVKPAGGQSRPSCRPRRLQGNQARKPVLDWSAPLDLNGLQSKLIRPALEAIGLPVSRPTVSNVQGGPSARRSWHRSTDPQRNDPVWPELVALAGVARPLNQRSPSVLRQKLAE